MWQHSESRQRSYRYISSRPWNFYATESCASLPLQEFYENVKHALQKGIFPGDNGRFNIVVAQTKNKSKDIVGAVMVSSTNIIEAREKKTLAFDFYDGVRGDDDVVFLRAIAVLPQFRRNGVGSELVFAGVRSLATDPRIQAVRC